MLQHDQASSGRGWQLHYDQTLSGSYTSSLNNATSTYMLQIHPTGTATTAATNLWFFDSGDVECEGRNVNNNGCVDGAQLAWLRNHTQPPAPFGLAWVHIPVPGESYCAAPKLQPRNACMGPQMLSTSGDRVI